MKFLNSTTQFVDTVSFGGAGDVSIERSGSQDQLLITTPHGTMGIGPYNTSWCHFTTDRTQFHFQKQIAVTTKIEIYNTGTYFTGTEGYINSNIVYHAGNLLNATTSVDGKMSAVDKTKLDGIADSANNYVHPANHAATVITEDSTHRFITDTERTTWNGKLNASGGTISGTLVVTGLLTAQSGISLSATELNATILFNDSDGTADTEINGTGFGGVVSVIADDSVSKSVVSAGGFVAKKGNDGGFKTGNYKIVHDETEDTLNFFYLG